ncbi:MULTISPECIES: potassium-transporting ATPase subunit KdpB [Sphingomonas]|jgi:potassium-transporting ATPase ATP-binding subunit|uniref:Potassium-transporting ATPase ATP-binding subunit n=2 Tax=Sphingomonas melonis TaxID=152682 RepID=A0A175Y648_9SPHN|nr:MULTISPECIES: potassium-transporting ATPase subunit KdpB [Sphingomonas]AOW24952.1 potassium-transporting ATPase subunit B [Sphingomonas melonis TY]ATI57005.1 K(+)-transporting ATPase subunit B [Sphingomonas melonis]KZB96272.1 potassium-transporting ATPase subunit B [Sphingomonas melonis TY]MBI0533371.1 K(+)-transporting ATPase subunit B [Sphingomonas sp. TX0522]MBX8845574.1 potassium-transporting ATPase subunit KdpB [Sphingomonas melonis]
MAQTRNASLFTAELIVPAIRDAFVKLDPRQLIRNPVMFTTAVVAVLLTVLLAVGQDGLSTGFKLQLVVWLWLTVLFGTFAEALAEGRGKAQAASLRDAKAELKAKRLIGVGDAWELVAGTRLSVGDVVLVETGDLIPSDGEVIQGVASVNEAAITGESAPVIREAGGDRSAVTAGTRVISDSIKVRVTVEPGQGFLDRMIALVEGAERQKTPNEIALTILLTGLTIIFLIAVATIPGFASYAGGSIPVAILAALLITLIPTTIAALLSAIGIAGMDRLVRFNVLAKSGRAVEAAGDIDVLLLDKTGTITIGDRQASEFRSVGGASAEDLAEAALLASLADETPEGRSIVVLARERFGQTATLPDHAEVIAFTAQTRVSGVRIGDTLIQKGAVDSILRANPGSGETAAATELRRITDEIARAGGTPLAVAKDGRLLGAIFLKDVVKAGIRERFAELRQMGIRTVMITGDNPLTAAAIAAEAGVDDFLAQATPEDKLDLIRKEQTGGRLVAMCGDGTNDAPALAQADVGVAMNTGTQAAREAGNMVDLDSDPTKLIEVVGLGKQLLMTRGALTTFSVANDVAKYFAIIPAMFVALYPGLGVLNVMGLTTPQSAILSAIIFNALIIPALVPLALKGVTYRPMGAGPLLARNLAIYGLGGLLAPFIGIKLIDIVVGGLGLA